MKLRTKIAILAIAVVLTFIGFNSLVTPAALDLVDMGIQTDYEIIVLAQADGPDVVYHTKG